MTDDRPGMRVVATAGHVDHGKSTLLRALTGMEPDRWEEERRRGLTIDLGFVWTDLDTPAGPLTVAFVDVPGHERFVANMLAGAGAAPLALFVVAADDGWSAQSREHLDILDLLGVPAAVVAITKLRIAGDERAREVATDVGRRLAGTSLDGAPIMIVDGVSGEGVDGLRDQLSARLAATPDAPDRDRPRLWVDRAFTISGAGTVVTGTLAGGALQVGQELALLPLGRTTRIRGMQALGKPAERVDPGARVALNLAGVDLDEVARGDVVVGITGADGRTALRRWRPTREVDAWVTALPGAEIDRSGAWHIHAGSAEVPCELHPLLGEAVVPGRPAYVRIVLARPVTLASGDRFVLRETGRRATLGGGEVIDPAPPGRVRGPDARLERVEELDAIRVAPPGARRIRPLARAWGGAGQRDRLLAAAGTDVEEAEAGLVRLADHLVDAGRLEAWRSAIHDALADEHADDPQSPGARKTPLLGAARRAGCPPSIADDLLESLAAGGDLVRVGAAYVLPGQAPAQDDARRRRREELLATLNQDPFSPPSIDEVAKRIGMHHGELNELVQSGDVVVCGEVAFARGAVAQAVSILRELAAGGRFTTAEAREALGTTRKYAIPLLEHLDATGFTDFDGQTRRVRHAG